MKFLEVGFLWQLNEAFQKHNEKKEVSTESQATET